MVNVNAANNMTEVKKTPEELKDSLFSLAETLDLVVEELADSEAGFKKLDKMEKVTLSVIKNTSDEKTESAKERYAYSHPRYLEWIGKWSDSQRKFLGLRARRDGLEIKIKATISALAFDRTMIELAK